MKEESFSYRKKIALSILLILVIFAVEFTLSFINGFLTEHYDLRGREINDILTDILIVCINLYVIYLFVKRFKIKIPTTKVKKYQYILYSTIFIFLILILNSYIENIFINLIPSFSALSNLSYSNENISFHSVVFWGLLYPLIEELSFRGILYQIIREKSSFLFSALIVSLLFFLVHPVPQEFVLFFGISFTLCYLYEKYKSIVPSLIFHCSYNILIIIIWKFFR